jgi:hypothetical protein
MGTTSSTARARSRKAGPARRITRRTLAGAGALALAGAAGIASAEWNFAPRIGVGAVTTDNVALQPDGLEQDELAVRLRPGFMLTNEDSGRLDAEVTYELDALFYTEDSDRDESFHNLAAQGLLEAVPRRFFIQGSAVYDQAIIDASAPIPLSNVSITSNRADYWSADVNPYFIQEIGSSLYARADYAFGAVRYDDVDPAQGSNVDDLERRNVIGTFGTRPDNPGIAWTAVYDSQVVDYDRFGQYELESAIADVRFPVGQQWVLIGRGGVETDATIDARTGGLEADLWEAGLRFERSRDEFIEVRAGNRFFGNTYFAEIEKGRGRGRINLSYNEQPTTIGLEQLLLPDVEQTPGQGPGFQITDLNDDLYVNKELAARITWRTARMTFGLDLRDIKREYLENDFTDGEQSVGFSWNWQLGPRTTVELYGFGATVEFPGTEVEDELKQGIVTISRRLGRQTLVDLSFRHDRRDSDTVQQANVYRENAVELMLTRWFGNAQPDMGGASRGGSRGIRR